MNARHVALLVALIGMTAPALGDELAPIPLDTKKVKANVDRRRAVTLDLTLHAYQKSGRRNAKWDRIVAQAMQAYVEGRHGLLWDKPIAAASCRELLALALEAGCDDPMVRYLQRKHPSEPGELTAERKSKFQDAVQALAASKYPDLLKALAWQSAIDEWLTVAPGDNIGEDEHKAAVGCLHELLKLLLPICRAAQAGQREEVLTLCAQVHQSGQLIGERQQWFDRLDAEVFAKLGKDDPLPHAVAGIFLLRHAWGARGSGYAPSVTAEGWRLLKQRLTEAERRLVKAWDLDKTNADVAAAMIPVCMGLGHDRKTMEMWFNRALEADPVHEDAFQMKLTYLLPKWHGNRQESLDFARQIVRSGRWDTGQPLTALAAHMELAFTSGEPAAYFRNRAEVWSDVEPIIEEIRKRYPKSPLGASIYLFFACASERNAAEANEYVKAAEDGGVEVAGGWILGPLQIERAKGWLRKKLEKENQ